MVRFVRAVDGQTIVVDRNGTQVMVALEGVTVQPEDQAAARAYLEHELTGYWLMVDGGNVYRSPDVFFVNRAMQQRGYFTAGHVRERFLGEADFEPRKTTGSSAATAPTPRPAPKTSTRTSRRSSTPRRRG